MSKVIDINKYRADKRRANQGKVLDSLNNPEITSDSISNSDSLYNLITSTFPVSLPPLPRSSLHIDPIEISDRLNITPNMRNSMKRIRQSLDAELSK